MSAMDARAIAEWFAVFDWAPADPSWPQRRRATWAWRKFKKARRWVRVLRFVPFVHMIAIGNTLGYGSCSLESDIDLVIVTAPRRVWTVRLLVVALLRFFRQRPGEHSRDAICPSFFLTTEALNLEPLQIPECRVPSAECRVAGASDSSLITHHSSLPTDPYLLFWPTQLTVLYDEFGTYDAFWRANEQWVRQWIPDARPRAIHPRLIVGTPPPLPPLHPISPPHVGRGSACPPKPCLALPKRFAKEGRRRERGWGGRFGDSVERQCRRFQERRFSPEIRALANQDSRVVVNDRMLKFHTNDRREEYRDRWLKRLRT